MIVCHAEIVTAQAACQPIDALADIAVVKIQLGEENSMFTPIKPPPSEDAPPPPAPAAAPPPAKAPAKGAPAKAPAATAAKGSSKGAVAPAADQPPPVGAPELGRALELLGTQVQKYYAWREEAVVHGLQAEPVSEDDLAGYRSFLSDIPQVSVHISFKPLLSHFASHASACMLLLQAPGILSIHSCTRNSALCFMECYKYANDLSGSCMTRLCHYLVMSWQTRNTLLLHRT